MQITKLGRQLCLISTLLVVSCGSIKGPRIPIKDLEICEAPPIRKGEPIQDDIFCSKILSKTVRMVPAAQRDDFMSNRPSFSIDDWGWMEYFIETICSENPKLCDRTFVKKTREFFERVRKGRNRLPPTMDVKND
jgi:hypothetical protein